MSTSAQRELPAPSLADNENHLETLRVWLSQEDGVMLACRPVLDEAHYNGPVFAHAMRELAKAYKQKFPASEESAEEMFAQLLTSTLLSVAEDAPALMLAICQVVARRIEASTTQH